MPKLKSLSGKDLARIFNQHGFIIYRQKGSHIKLKRVTETGNKQILVIPNHKEIDKGTLLAIIRQAVRFIPLQELKKLFYTG